MVVLVAPLCHTLSPPPFLAHKAVHLDIAHTYHLPSSAICICALRCIPASAAVSWVRLPPLCRPRPASRSLSSPAGFVRRRSLRLSCVLPPSLFAAPLPGIFWFLVSMGVHFVQGWGSRAPPLPGSRSSRPPPPLHGHAGAISLTGSPPNLPPPPPCYLYPIPIGEGGGASW